MISDSAYIEILKSCSKWNSRTICGRKRSDTAVFDQQTGVVQKPTEHLYRHYTERCPPRDNMQVCAYPSCQWTKSKEISSAACEMKYFLNASSALNDVIMSLSNPNTTINPISNEVLADQNTPMRSMYSRYEINDIDISEYDIEEPDNDPSDEDDWGVNKKRRRKNQPSSSHKSRRSNASGLNGNNNSSLLGTPTGASEPRPFVCQLCNAKYKSRPGLTYHRIHVHQDGNNHSNQETPKSPIVNPPVKTFDTCDFCLGTRLSNREGKPEELISCNDCGHSGHPLCLKFTANMLISTKRHGWQCIECKSCAVCGTSENDDQLLFCDDCDRGFHLYCLTPPLQSPPETDWSCDLCLADFGKKSSMMVARAAMVATQASTVECGSKT